MRWRTLTAATLTAACAAVAFVALATWSTADAQTRRGQRAGAERAHVDRAPARAARRARARTRITVRRERSFLDPGTEVEPGSRSYTDYAFPPGGNYPLRVYDPTRDWRYPLPDPFYLPGCCLDY